MTFLLVLASFNAVANLALAWFVFAVARGHHQDMKNNREDREAAKKRVEELCGIGKAEVFGVKSARELREAFDREFEKQRRMACYQHGSKEN